MKNIKPRTPGPSRYIGINCGEEEKTDVMM